MSKGLVIKSTGSWYTIEDGGKVIQCRIKGKFRTRDIVTTTPITVGDKVTYELQKDGKGMITDIDERSNYIIRRATRFHKEAHLLAANIDQAMIMITFRQPNTPREFIDRFLITAEAYNIKSFILINKFDLIDNESINELNEFKDTYIKAGYSYLEISCLKNINIDKAYELLKNKMTLLAGNSGVGKSTFINLIAPSLNLKTEDISDFHQTGKHTTTFSEIFKINNDTYIIDTPGIKAFGIIDIDKEEVGLYFPEIFKTSKSCKFYNCTHLHEPDCAVIEAVQKNEIGFSRYRSYVSIMNDEESKYRQ